MSQETIKQATERFDAKREVSRSILATSHELWKTSACTVHLVEILDQRVKEVEEWLDTNCTSREVPEFVVRGFLAQLRETKKIRSYIKETTTFVKKVIK